MPHWDVRLSIPVQDWELESLLTFMDLIYSKVVRGEGMDRICRRLPRVGFFRCEVNITLLSSSNGKLFPWKVVRQSKAPIGLPSFLGLLHYGRYYLLTIFGTEVLLYWIGATRVRGVGSPWIIFFFISLQVVDNSVVYLDSNGLCQKGLLIYLQLGKVLSASIEIFLLGRLCHIASWGVFSKKGMLEFLREVNYFFFFDK